MQEIKVERTHLFAPNISVVIKVEISGNPSDMEIETAIKKSAENSEALCQRIVIAQDGRAYFEKAEPFINIISTQQKWTDIAAELPKTPFRIFDGELVRFFIIRRQDKLELMVAGHHLIADGLGYAYLLERILCTINGQQMEHLPFQTVSVGGFPQKSKMRLVVRSYLQMLNRRWLRHKEVFSVSDYERLTAGYAQQYRGNVFEDRLSPIEVERLKVFAKESGVTVNSVLAVAFLKAYNKTALVGMPVSIREQGNRMVNNQASGLSITYQYDSSVSFSVNCQKVHMLIYDFLQNDSRKYFALRFSDMFDGSLLDSVCMGKYLDYQNPVTEKMMELMNYNDHPRDLGITNLTNVSIPARYGKYEISNLGFVAPVVPYGVRVIAIATFENEMSITMNTIAKEQNAEKAYFAQAVMLLREV